MSDTTDKILITCPNCKKHYRVPATMAGKQASCKCGTVFPIPLSAAAVPDEDSVADAVVPVPAQASPTDCAFHPGTPALLACADCHRLLCRKCSYPQRDGRHLCTECALRAASPQVAGLQAFSSSVLVGTCQVHREVEAIARCRYCNVLLCATCDFRFPGDFHLCARCAIVTPRGLSRSRKIVLIGSLVALGWVVLAIIAKFVVVASLPADASPLVLILVQQLLLAMVLEPSIVGLGLALGSVSRREGNPPLVWVSLALNALMSAIWLVTLIVQILRGSGPPGV